MLAEAPSLNECALKQSTLFHFVHSKVSCNFEQRIGVACGGRGRDVGIALGTDSFLPKGEASPRILLKA